MKKFRTRILTTGIIVSLAATSVLPVVAATKSEVKSKIEENQSELNAINGLIGNWTTEKASMETQVEALDLELNELMANLADLNAQMETKQTEIDTTKAELEVAKEDEEQQYSDMKKRIRFMYENGNGALIEVLLQADSITDLLNKAEYVSKISEYDRNMLIKYQETKDSIAAMEVLLEQEYAELETVSAEVSAKQADVEVNIQAKNQEIANYTSSISDAEKDALAYEYEIAADNAILAQIEKEEKIAAEKAAAEKAAADKAATDKAATDKAAAEKAAAQKAADQKAASSSSASSSSASGSSSSSSSSSGSSSSSSSTSSLLWPCPSSYTVSCEFGPRNAPTAGASTNHRGIDIPAGYGSAIVAAAAGTVDTAGYDVSSGNYIIINHGNGLKTIYMHASALYVSAGQTVSAGTTIAAVGSTGVSTGNHLHFGVIVNGSYVNPRNYL